MNKRSSAIVQDSSLAARVRNDGHITKKGVAAGAAVVRVSSLRSEQATTAAPAAFLATACRSFRMERSGMRNLKQLQVNNF